MKKFLIGMAAGFVLAALTGVVLLFAIARLAEPRPAVQADSTLILNLQGEVPEHQPIAMPFPALESHEPITLAEWWELLAAAADDPKIQAAVLLPQDVSVGWGKLQEIRECLLKFKKSGKPLVAYLRGGGMREYYLATAADSIYLAQEDWLNVKGLRIEAMYLRGTLDKLGVSVEIEHAGKYKDAGDTYTRDSMSPETREVLNSLLDETFEHVIETIAGARGQTVEQIRQAIDTGPFLANEAVAKGLVDELIYEDEMYEKLKSRLDQDEIRKLSYKEYSRFVRIQSMASNRSRIALLTGSGSILSGSGGYGWGDEEILWSRDFIRTIRRVKDDDSIKGVMLRIDSPGGDATASDEILREIRLLSEEKPLVVSMSDVAASGGYYIAMSGDPIVAYPNTITGSIGVIYGKMNLRGLYDKIGVKKEILTRGRFAAIDSDYQPLGPAEREKLREGVEAVYESFLTRVSEGRDLKREEIEPLAQGRVWLGSQARQNGLVDELGGLDRSVELIKEMASIPADEKVRLVFFPERKSFWEYLLGQDGESILNAKLRDVLGGVDPRLFERPGVWKLMPFRLEFQ